MFRLATFSGFLFHLPILVKLLLLPTMNNGGIRISEWNPHAEIQILQTEAFKNFHKVGKSMLLSLLSSSLSLELSFP